MAIECDHSKETRVVRKLFTGGCLNRIWVRDHHHRTATNSIVAVQEMVYKIVQPKCRGTSVDDDTGWIDEISFRIIKASHCEPTHSLTFAFMQCLRRVNHWKRVRKKNEKSTAGAADLSKQPANHSSAARMNIHGLRVIPFNQCPYLYRLIRWDNIYLSTASSFKSCHSVRGCYILPFNTAAPGVA